MDMIKCLAWTILLTAFAIVATVVTVIGSLAYGMISTGAKIVADYLNFIFPEYDEKA